MPTRFRPDEKPIVEFDPRLEISPFVLFRRLQEGRGPQLIDVRREPGELVLEGSIRLPGTAWAPEPGAEIVLFDEDGSEALPLVQSFQSAGFEGVKMLFGGLELYEFALSPEVVGAETFLRRKR